MKYKIALLLLLSPGLLFFHPTFVHSESNNTFAVGSAIGEAQNIKQNVINKNEGVLKENKIEVKEALQLKKETKEIEVAKIKEDIKEKKETFMQTLQTEREARKTKIEEMQTNLKKMRDDFKAKIETIKDEHKKQLTEKIDLRMSTVNKNQTDRMTDALGKLTEHVNKLEERINKAKGSGVNVATVETLIATAKTAISTSLAIVEEQAAKDYVFTITDEKNLGASVKTSYDALSKDLKNAQDSLVKAKEAVVAAYKAAGALEKITPIPTVVITP